MYRLHALLGRILEKKGERTAAAAQYRESDRRIAKLREELGTDLRSSFAGLPAVREVESWISAHPAAPGPGGPGAARKGRTPSDGV